MVLKAIQIENYAQSYIGFYSSMPTWFLHLHSLRDTFNNEYFLFVFSNKGPDAMVEMCKYAGNGHPFTGMIFLYDL